MIQPTHLDSRRHGLGFDHPLLATIWAERIADCSPGATDLLTLHGAEHGLGGVVGYEVAETTDEDLERVAVVQRMGTAYLRPALHIDEDSWPAARAAFSDGSHGIGHVDTQ